MMEEFLQDGYATLSGLEGWLRAHEQFTSTATVAIIAWALAAWVQGRGKRWEFRAHTLRDVSIAYNRLLLAAVKMNAAVRAAGMPDPSQVAKISERDVRIFVAPKPQDFWMEFHDRRNECSAMKPIVELHFKRKDVRDHYQGVLDHLTATGDPDRSIEAREDDIQKAQLEWNEFLLCAGIEVGVNTWWRRLRREARAKWRRLRKQTEEER